MAAYQKFNIFVESIMNKEQDLFGVPPTDIVKLGLTNTLPSALDTHLDTVLSPDVLEATSNAAEIVSGFGYTEGGATPTNQSGTRATGTFTLGADEVVWTAAGGTMATFRYTYLYNNVGGAAATRPIIAWWDYGSAVSLLDGETFTVRFNNDATIGTIFTLA